MSQALLLNLRSPLIEISLPSIIHYTPWLPSFFPSSLTTNVPLLLVFLLLLPFLIIMISRPRSSSREKAQWITQSVPKMGASILNSHDIYSSWYVHEILILNINGYIVYLLNKSWQLLILTILTITYLMSSFKGENPVLHAWRDLTPYPARFRSVANQCDYWGSKEKWFRNTS